MAALGPAGETAYLTRFGGSWSGSGAVRLAPGTPLMTVNCQLEGAPDGAALSLSGRCGGGLIGSDVHARLSYDARSGGYRGSWSAGGSSATLAGARHGERLAFEVAAPDEPGRQLTLALEDGRLSLSMTRTDDHAEVLRLALAKG